MKDKEIEVVKNMIRLLQECYVINIKSFNYKEAREVFNDIRVCKLELKKIRDRNAAIDQVKDVERDITNDQERERSGRSVF